MRLVVDGGHPLRGRVTVPADKSITHRALIFNALATGLGTVRAYAPGQDNRSTAGALRGLGVSIQDTADGWVVQGAGGRFAAPSSPLDCGNSGTTLRLLCGVLAGAGVRATLRGDASLSRRPMGRVCDPLRALGAAIEGTTRDGREVPPVRVSAGAFRGGDMALKIASAQVKSALLLAGVTAGCEVSVKEPSLSRDHTERLLSAMGAAVERTYVGACHRVTLGRRTQLQACNIDVPGDISSAAFLAAAALMVPGSEVVVEAVGLNPTRTGLLEVLESMGADLEPSSVSEASGEPIGTLTVRSWTNTAGRVGKVAGAMVPRLVDELVVLAAVGAPAGGVEFADAAELRVKESDRIDETLRLLRAFGVEGEGRPDGLRVRGGQRLRPAVVDVSTDHRIALTGAVLACAAPGRSVLEGFDVAAVSFPGLPETLRRLGARVEIA